MTGLALGSRKCASLKVPKKAQNSAYSYIENKRHLSARIVLGVLLYSCKRHRRNSTRMDLGNAFLKVPCFSVPFHPSLFFVPFLRAFSPCLFSVPCHPMPFPPCLWARPFSQCLFFSSFHLRSSHPYLSSVPFRAFDLHVLKLVKTHHPMAVTEDTSR